MSWFKKIFCCCCDNPTQAEINLAASLQPGKLLEFQEIVSNIHLEQESINERVVAFIGMADQYIIRDTLNPIDALYFTSDTLMMSDKCSQQIREQVLKIKKQYEESQAGDHVAKSEIEHGMICETKNDKYEESQTGYHNEKCEIDQGMVGESVNEEFEHIT